MTSRLEAIVARRTALVARAAAQRVILADATAELLPSHGLGRGLLSIPRLAAGHPGWAAAASALGALLLFRRRRVAVWLGRAFVVWRAWQGLQALMKRNPAR